MLLTSPSQRLILLLACAWVLCPRIGSDLRAQTIALRTVATMPTPEWSYVGVTTFVRPGDRFAGALGFGLEGDVVWGFGESLGDGEQAEGADFWKHVGGGLTLGYRNTAIQELLRFPSETPRRIYRQHRAYLRPSIGIQPLKWLRLDVGPVISYTLNDLSEVVLEDYRGLSVEEQARLPAFTDPVGVGGVYMTGNRFNYGPSAALTLRWRRLSATLRYDRLLATLGERSLREIDFNTRATSPLQTSRFSLREEWSGGIALDF